MHWIDDAIFQIVVSRIFLLYDIQFFISKEIVKTRENKNKFIFGSHLVVILPTSARSLVISISVNISKRKMIRECHRFE